MPAVVLFIARSLTVVIFAAIGLAVGGYWFLQGLRLLQRRRQILNAPESTIENAPIGLVEVSGLSESPYVMLSPLNRTECHYYRAVAWQLKRSGDDNFWRKVAEESLHVPFYLNDGSGQLLVDPRGAEIDLQCEFRREYHRSLPLGKSETMGPEMPGSVADFLTRHGIDLNTGIKVEEYCIKPKTLLFALGTLSQNPGLDASVKPAWAQRAGERGRDHAGARNNEGTQTHVVRLSETNADVPAAAMTQQQKIAAALSRAGINNPAAWNPGAASVKAARAEAANSSIAIATAVEAAPQDADDAESFDLHPPLVLMKGTHQPEFFISWQSQHDLPLSTEWRGYVMIAGGPALLLGCIYLIAHFAWL